MAAFFPQSIAASMAYGISLLGRQNAQNREQRSLAGTFGGLFPDFCQLHDKTRKKRPPSLSCKSLP